MYMILEHGEWVFWSAVASFETREAAEVRFADRGDKDWVIVKVIRGTMVNAED